MAGPAIPAFTHVWYPQAPGTSRVPPGPTPTHQTQSRGHSTQTNANKRRICGGAANQIIHCYLLWFELESLFARFPADDDGLVANVSKRKTIIITVANDNLTAKQ